MLKPGGVVQVLTNTRTAVAVTACTTFVIIGFTKYLIVLGLTRLGASRFQMQLQDAMITGALSATVVWVLLAGIRECRRQAQLQMRAVTDLHHHIRNAIEVIVGSDYIRESNKANAILDSVRRIDRALGDSRASQEGWQG